MQGEGEIGRLVLSLQPGETVTTSSPVGAVKVLFRRKSGRRIFVEIDAPKTWRIDRTPPPAPPNPGGRAA